jgi:AcrR family transcriptional regulator
MPKLKPDTHRARREHILEAAELCFARAGFHRTTMQDISREAGVSLGALYVYFKSKEDLIAGLSERDRARIGDDLAQVAAAPDLMAALKALGERLAIEEPRHKRLLCVEIGLESTRNPQVGAHFASVDRFVRDSFVRLLSRAKEEGRIAPPVEVEILAEALAVIGDGIFWRRAVDPGFDAKRVMPALLASLSGLINPVEPAKAAAAGPAPAAGTRRAANEEL